MKKKLRDILIISSIIIGTLLVLVGPLIQSLLVLALGIIIGLSGLSVMIVFENDEG